MYFGLLFVFQKLACFTFHFIGKFSRLENIIDTTVYYLHFLYLYGVTFKLFFDYSPSLRLLMLLVGGGEQSMCVGVLCAIVICLATLQPIFAKTIFLIRMATEILVPLSLW